MGVTLSTHEKIAPLAVVSTTIGFVSFVFTLATAFRVFAENLKTIAGAPTEMSDMLTNLRQSLFEERAHLRKIRRYRKRRPSPRNKEKYESVGNDAAIDAMYTGIKHMITNFRELEKPFLRDGRLKEALTEDARGGYSSGGPRDDDNNDYYHCEYRYRRCGLWERYLWLRSKSKFVSISELLSRVEIRRLSLQGTEVSIWMRDLGYRFGDFDRRLDAIDRLEQRMSRVVGVRKVNNE